MGLFGGESRNPKISDRIMPDAIGADVYNVGNVVFSCSNWKSGKKFYFEIFNDENNKPKLKCYGKFGARNDGYIESLGCLLDDKSQEFIGDFLGTIDKNSNVTELYDYFLKFSKNYEEFLKNKNIKESEPNM